MVFVIWRQSHYMDFYIINLAQSLRLPVIDGVMLFFTYLGNWQVVLAEVVLICIFYAEKKRWDYILAVLFAVGGGEVLVWLIKHLIQRPRPFLIDDLIYEKSFSFPSGHAFIAIAFYGLLTYFLVSAAKNRLLKKLMIAACAFLSLTIGISRIYLGVHWPTDVLAGFALGAIWLALTIKGLSKK